MSSPSGIVRNNSGSISKPLEMKKPSLTGILIRVSVSWSRNVTFHIEAEVENSNFLFLTGWANAASDKTRKRKINKNTFIIFFIFFLLDS